MADETGWIIEKYQHSVLVYWTGQLFNGVGYFVSDSLRAIRFARQEDAQKMLSWHLNGEGRAVERMWVEK